MARRRLGWGAFLSVTASIRARGLAEGTFPPGPRDLTRPVLAEGTIPLGPRDTIADVHDRAHRMFPALVMQAIDALERDAMAGRPQDESKACYWHQRADGDGRVRLSKMTAVEVDRMVRAL